MRSASNNYLIRLAMALLVLALVANANAEPGGGAVPSGDVVSAEEGAAAVEGAAQSVEKFYVFPEVGAKIAANLRTKQKQGAYRELRDAPTLVSSITTDLQAVNGDKHLRVTYKPSAMVEKQEQPAVANPAEVEEYENHGFVKVERLPGNIGYIKAQMFYGLESSRATVTAAMNFVAETDALIIDLRDHHGGDPATVAFLISYLVGPERIHLNDFYDRDSHLRGSTYTQAEVPGHRYGATKPVYALINGKTFSGAEELVYDLQALKRATLVGQPTGGGANPGGYMRISDHFSVFVPTGRAHNPITGTNWEGVGVQPDIVVTAEEALRHVHGLLLRKIDLNSKPIAARKEIEQALATLEAKG